MGAFGRLAELAGRALVGRDLEASLRRFKARAEAAAGVAARIGLVLSDPAVAVGIVEPGVVEGG